MQVARNRSRIVRSLLATLAGVALLLTAPGVASARHRHHESGRHHGPRVVRHGPTCGHQSSYRQGRRHRSHKQVGYRNHDESYTCEPCGHRFRSRRHFHRHIHRVHHVPFWRLPLVIAHTTIGWIFHGY